MIRVLFVCLGNICRSPTAHGVLLERLQQEGLADKVEVDSAGTAGWHVGKPADERSQKAAAARGFDLSKLRARQVQISDFSEFDYVLAMDESNLENLKVLLVQAKTSANTSAKKLTEPKLFLRTYSRSYDEHVVPDPYYGGDSGFRHVLDLIEDACDGLIDDIRKQLR